MESLNEEKQTLIHISHLHPLKLIDCHETKPVCHACHQPCVKPSYGCDKCFYFLHSTCASFTKTLKHPSHSTHTLNLFLTPPYDSGAFLCNACGQVGYTFCFHCKECDFDLHSSCASLPEKLTHPSHPHSLELIYENPYPENVECTCDQCEDIVDLSKWFYVCRECDYGGHMDCFTSSEKLEERLRLRNENEQVAQQQAENNISNQRIQLLQMQTNLNLQMMALKMQKDMSAAVLSLIG